MPNKLKIKRGPSSTLPAGELAEPLFTTDTYDLYIGNGDGTNTRFQKYIAGGVVGGSGSAGQMAYWSGPSTITGASTLTYDSGTDKLSMTNGYVNNNLTIDGQLVIKSESGATAYTRGLKFPDNSYGGTGDTAGLRLTNNGGENIVLELYVGNDSLDTINFAVAAGGSTYNDNVTVNGNKIWNAGNLPSPLSSTGTINSGEIAIFSNGTTVYSDSVLFWDNSLNRLGIGGTSPMAQVGVTTSSGVNAFGYRTSGALYYEMAMLFDNTTYGHLIQTGRAGSTSAKNFTILNGSTIFSLNETYNAGINTLSPIVDSTSNSAYGLNIYSPSNTIASGLSLTTISSGTTSADGARIILRNDGSLFIRNLETGGMLINAGDGNYEIITNGSTNFKIDSTTGKIGIGNPASIAEMLTVNGSIQQSGVTSAITKTDANGKIIAAVAGTDYVAPSALSGYVPTSRTLTINGTTYDLSANRSWIVGIIDGGGSAGRVTYWSDADTVTSDGGFIYDSATKRLGVNTTVPNATIGATNASGYGLLVKNADANYGGIGMGVDATYGNLINTEKVGTAPARNLTMLNQAGYISLDESGNMGVNILTPNASTSGPGGIGIDIYSSTTAALAFHNSTSGTGSTNGGRIYYNSTNMTIRNLETGNISITADDGNFQVITLGAENIKVEGSTGKVGIGAPASIAEMLTVNGSIQQSGVTSSMLKANASGKIIAAVSNTDFQAPITLTTTGTSGASTFNGTTLNIPQYQAALTNPVTGSGTSGYHAKFTSTGSTIGNGLIYDGGSRSIAVGNSSTNPWASPFYVIEGGTYGQFLGYQTNVAAIKLGVNAYFNGTSYIYTNNSLGIAILDLTGDATNASLNFYTAPAGTAGNPATLSPRFIIDNTGNAYFGESLGVGLTSGTLNGRIDFRNAGNAIIVGKNTTGGTLTYSSIRLTTANSGGVGDSIGEIRGISTNVNNRDTALTFLTSNGTSSQSEAMRITKDRNVNIGDTSDTSYKLNVNGTINVTGAATFSNNVGIGVTPSSWSQGKALEVGSLGNGIWNASDDNTFFVNNAYYNSGWKYARSNYATYYSQTAGEHRFYIASSGTAGNAITFNPALTIASTGAATFSSSVQLSSLVTAPSYGSGSTGLNIGYMNLQNVVGVQACYANNIYFDGSNWKSISSLVNWAAAVRLAGGNIDFHSASVSSSGQTISNWDTTDLKMRITSGGNVGIGTTSNYDGFGYGSIRYLTQYNAAGTSHEIAGSTTANDTYIGSLDFINASNAGTAGSGRYGIAAIRAYTVNAGATNTGGGYMAFYTKADAGTGAERMRITSGGDLLVGTTTGYWSQANRKVIELNATTDVLFGLKVGDVKKGHVYHSGTDMQVVNEATGYLRFSTDATERMRITSGGAVYINTTSALPGSGTPLHVYGDAAGPSFKNATTGQQTLMLWNAVSSGDNLLLEFNVNTTILGKGSIDYNRASNVIRYNTTSDANLKNIIGDSDKQKSIDILNSTRIREYFWKEDKNNKPQIGVIAQELYQTFKGAVSKGSDQELFGTKDYKYWGVDKTAFTFHLIAGWQEHERIIKEQQAQIEELKSKLN